MNIINLAPTTGEGVIDFRETDIDEVRALLSADRTETLANLSSDDEGSEIYPNGALLNGTEQKQLFLELYARGIRPVFTPEGFKTFLERKDWNVEYDFEWHDNGDEAEPLCTVYYTLAGVKVEYSGGLDFGSEEFDPNPIYPIRIEGVSVIDDESGLDNEPLGYIDDMCPIDWDAARTWLEATPKPQYRARTV